MAPTTTARDAPTRVTTVFYVLGSIFFGLAVLDSVVAAGRTISSILLIIFFAWLLVFVVAPVVDAAHRRLRIGRGKAIAIVYLGVVAVVGVAIVATAQIGAPQAAEILARGDEVTARVHRMLVDLQGSLGIGRDRIDLAAAFDQARQGAASTIAASLNADVQTFAGTMVTVMGDLFLIVVLSIYAMADFDGIVASLHRVVPNRYADELQLVEHSVGRAFGGFLRTQVILVTLQVGLTVVVGLLFGLPYLYLTTVGVALAMFIPFFGPPIALLPPLLVAIAFRPEAALPVLAVLFVVQTLIVNVLQPRLMKETAGLHPILVLVALLLGAQLAGLWGALFGIPIVAAGSLLVRYVVNRRAVNEVEGIDLEEVVAEVQAADPEVPRAEAVAIAADRAEALVEDRALPAGSRAPDVPAPQGSPTSPDDEAPSDRPAASS